MKLLFAIAFLFLAATQGYSQKEDSIFIGKLSDEILSNGKAYDNLRQLTKNIGARLSGSPQTYKAEAWGLKMLNESGATRAWLQECRIPHWIRGGVDKAEASYNAATVGARNYIPGRKSLDVLALGNSFGTGLKGLTAEVVEVKSYDDLERMKDSVKGKIVFYNYKFNPTFISTFGSYGDAVKYRGSGPSRAAKYGAVAVIVRSMTHATDNNPHTGATRYDTAISQNKIPAIAVGLKDADWLSTTLEKKKVQVFIKTNGQMLPDTIAHNVIGELRGSEFPDQYITVGGHLDSWDPAEGAHDDGTGVVQTIEILRAFKALGYQPKHTIRFVLFANEENGGKGGDKYAAEAKEKNEKHIFAMESDAGGFTPRGFGLTGTPEQYKKFLSFQNLISPYGCSEFRSGGGGSDIGELGKAFQTPLCSINPDSQRYFDIHHARSDVFENVNKRELTLGAVNMAALIYLVDKYGL